MDMHYSQMNTIVKQNQKTNESENSEPPFLTFEMFHSQQISGGREKKNHDHSWPVIPQLNAASPLSESGQVSKYAAYYEDVPRPIATGA
ncbi:hypothetical protein CDAR_91561 [Caerostris darwini]|uniref:Uncharacterized protein n=1 Tax=Caerostris darwini TaxID=1538125 RepID=A0AAV4WDJ5_9ARAC|nr:hypothetical protein CDAR_91561 [Caerostris darwini]